MVCLYLIIYETICRYKTRKDTEHCMKTMQHCLLDGKKLFIDWDAGFVEGRQYARVRRNRNNKESQNKSMSVYSSSSTKVISYFLI